MKTLTVALAALVLTACGSAATPAVTVTAPAPTVTVQAPEPAPAPELPDVSSSDGELIRSLLASQGFSYDGPTRDLEELSDSICEALDNGIEPSLLVQVAMDSGFTMDEGAALVAAAIIVVCPWNESAV
jgi:hypothetical protein